MSGSSTSIEWAAPGPYRVAFSTRIGGVSEGDFASLNLGILTEDDPARVVENRTRLCDAVGADPDGATMAWQRHGATVTRAQPRGIVTPGTVYDALRRAVDRRAGPRDAAAHRRLHADRDRAAGRAASRRRDPPRRLARPARRHRRGRRSRARRATKLAAAIGPSIGPCCYEVGDEVATPFREAFGEDVVRDGKLDLWTAAERALRAAGVEHVERLDICTVLRAGDVLLASARPRQDGTPGCHRLRRLRRSASATSACATRSARA